jgi:Na+/H+-dicarboxylate symporter
VNVMQVFHNGYDQRVRRFFGVMQAVSLDRFAGDLAVILAVDWFLDRCRTAVNVMGDAFAALVVDHLTRFRTSDVGGPSYQQVELT